MTKVSLYLDQQVWRRFREKVFRKHGGLRMLSAEVESLLRSQLIDEEVSTAFQKLGITVKGSISSGDIIRNRPKLRGLPSEKILRKMQRKRLAKAIL